MSHELTEPVYWRGRRSAVTSYGIEAHDGLYHVRASEIWPAEKEPPDWAQVLRSRYGIDADDFDAALAVARTVFSKPVPHPWPASLRASRAR